ncbi:hypothetical protein INT45_008765 [Circinella minor]|uniref:F-box domain-containing protein n=1 Tax=Circinella minor TaxID=1195481 RepID=A0A8H7VMZ8_9FUNG|nr:hypothetical protein INT45_008765 [Circinella minor]
MASICVNMSQGPNEISARLATALNLGFQQEQLPTADSLQDLSLKRHQPITAVMTTAKLEKEIQQLQEKQQSTNIHVDFICLLPYEVVSTILELFTTDELFEYMDVSHEWRKRIISFPILWHQVSIKQGQHGVLPKLSLVGQHIWIYTIHNGDDKVIQGSLEQMRSGSMNNIRSLTWENCISTPENILHSIRYLNNTLTDLTLTADREPTTTENHHSNNTYILPCLSSILLACPKLKRINVAFSTRIIQIPSNNELVTTTTSPHDLELTHLNWTTPFRPNDVEMETVLSNCKKLKYLQVGGYEASAPVFEIRKRYPNLQYISLGDVEAFGPDMDFWTMDNSNKIKRKKCTGSNRINNSNDDEDDKSGLHALAMPCTGPHGWSDIQELLAMDSTGLKKLKLYCGIDFPVDVDYLIRHFNGDRLSVHRTYAAWKNRAQVDAIITATEDIHAISTARSYTITSTFEMGDERGVLGFINALRTGTTELAHTVSRLRFWNCPGSAILLPLLLDLPCRLQALQFENCEFSTSILVGFLRSLKTSPWPTLQELGFVSIPSFTDDVVAEIAGIPGLKRVILWNCEDVTDQGVRSLLEEYSDLEDVDIGDCLHVTQEAVNYVKGKLETSKKSSSALLLL